MNPSKSNSIINDCLARGWLQVGNRLVTPAEAKQLNLEPETKPKRQKRAKRTGGIDDELNLRNKAKHTDQFTRLIEIELKLDVWPEYYFTTERLYRLDYAIPQFKIAIEVNGGIHMRGKSGHSSGKGIKRDMDKANLLNINGWTLIQVEPNELLTIKVIDLIKKAIED